MTNSRNVESVAGHVLSIMESGHGATVIVAVDGPGGSGKSTLAEAVVEKVGGEVVRSDDFYKPASARNLADRRRVGWAYDLSRLRSQVLEPLERGQAAHYQRYDWPSDGLVEWRHVAARQLVVVEGVYALRRDLRQYYHLAVWINCRSETRLGRMLDRGHGWPMAQYREWMSEEDRYLRVQRPDLVAALVLVGDPP